MSMSRSLSDQATQQTGRGDSNVATSLALMQSNSISSPSTSANSTPVPMRDSYGELARRRASPSAVVQYATTTAKVVQRAAVVPRAVAPVHHTRASTAVNASATTTPQKAIQTPFSPTHFFSPHPPSGPASMHLDESQDNTSPTKRKLPGESKKGEFLTPLQKDPSNANRKCHQCLNVKMISKLFRCTNEIPVATTSPTRATKKSKKNSGDASAVVEKELQKCTNVYCEPCLLQHYEEKPRNPKVWVCPACRHFCSCEPCAEEKGAMEPNPATMSPATIVAAGLVYTKDFLAFQLGQQNQQKTRQQMYKQSMPNFSPFIPSSTSGNRVPSPLPSGPPMANHSSSLVPQHVAQSSQVKVKTKHTQQQPKKIAVSQASIHHGGPTPPSTPTQPGQHLQKQPVIVTSAAAAAAAQMYSNPGQQLGHAQPQVMHAQPHVVHGQKFHQPKK